MRRIGQAIQLYASEFRGTIVPGSIYVSATNVQCRDTSLKPYMGKRNYGVIESTSGVDYFEIQTMQCPNDLIVRTYLIQQ